MKNKSNPDVATVSRRAFLQSSSLATAALGVQPMLLKSGVNQDSESAATEPELSLIHI